MDSSTRVLFVKDVRQKLLKKKGISLSISTVRRVMKAQGYTWKRFKNIQAYVNSQANIDNRQAFAKQMVKLLEQGKKIISIDEASFN